MTTKTLTQLAVILRHWNEGFYAGDVDAFYHDITNALMGE